jgi:hypothetical protein
MNDVSLHVSAHVHHLLAAQKAKFRANNKLFVMHSQYQSRSVTGGNYISTAQLYRLLKTGH